MSKNNLKFKRKIVKISLDDKIYYTPVTEMWGRAEFDICPVFKRGYLRQIHIIRRQQETKEEFVLDLERELNPSRIREFSITSEYGVEKPLPKIWRNFWCIVHKTISFSVYVPVDTNTIKFTPHFFLNSLDIIFTKGERR